MHRVACSYDACCLHLVFGVLPDGGGGKASISAGRAVLGGGAWTGKPDEGVAWAF